MSNIITSKYGTVSVGMNIEGKEHVLKVIPAIKNVTVSLDKDEVKITVEENCIGGRFNFPSIKSKKRIKVEFDAHIVRYFPYA